MIITVVPANTVAPVGQAGNDNNITNLEFFNTFLSVANENTKQDGTQKTIAHNNNNENFHAHENSLLNLTPQALSFLHGVDNNTATATVDATPPNTTANNYPQAIQQEQISATISEFSTLPFNSDTFAQIQSALINAGIDPQSISMQEIWQGMASMASPITEAENEAYATELASDLIAA